MIDAIKFRELVDALEASQRLSDWGAEGVATRNLERFMLSHADALLALVEMQPDYVRHPLVVKWRNDAIEACASTAERYQCNYAANDMRRMLTPETKP